MAKHRYSRKIRGQKRNKMYSKKIRGGYDSDDEEYRYESPPPPLRLSDLDSYSSQGSQNNGFSQENLQSQRTNYDDYSLDNSQGSQNNFSQGTNYSVYSQGPSLDIEDLDTTKQKEETLKRSFDSQEPTTEIDPKRLKMDPKTDYDTEDEKSDDDEPDAYESANEFDFNGGLKRKTNKRKSKKSRKSRKSRKSKKTRKNKKRRQRGGIIM